MPPIPWNRINTGLLLIVLLAIVGLFASRAYGGPLDPSGPPHSTLPQVEPRNPLGETPVTHLPAQPLEKAAIYSSQNEPTRANGGLC